MWGKIIITMYRLWLNGLYGLYGPRCPLFSKRPINLISLSLSSFFVNIDSWYWLCSRNFSRFLPYWQVCLLLAVIMIYTRLCHSLHAQHGLSLGLHRMRLSFPLKNSGNSHHLCEPIFCQNWGDHNLYLDPSLTKGWCQPFGGHVSCPTHNSNATRIGM